MNDDEIDAIVARVPDPALDGACMDDGVLQQYRQGLLEENRVIEVEGHLAGCADCRAFVAALAVPVPAGLEQWAISSAKRPRARIWLPAAAAVLVAIGSTLAIMGRLDSVPEYEQPQLSGGIQQLRAEPESSSNVFSPDGQLKLILRPKKPHQENVDLQVLVEQQDGSFSPAKAGTVMRGEDGVFRFEANAGALLGTAPGRRRIELVVGGSQKMIVDVEISRKD